MGPRWLKQKLEPRQPERAPRGTGTRLRRGQPGEALEAKFSRQQREALRGAIKWAFYKVLIGCNVQSGEGYGTSSWCYSMQL